jgi:rhodanese-related sulfurtransferase
VTPARLVLTGALTLSALIGSGCSSDSSDQPAAQTTAPSSAILVDSATFAQRMEAPGVVTINVHTPDEGSIAGTDLTIPFDQIATSDELPEDRDTPLAVYCRSGNMSADAVTDLETLGYTDIVELEGGFNAWTAEGRPLLPPSSG